MMKPIAVNQLSDNFFETISKEWMLVTAGNKDAFNTMTANWGGIGFLWNKTGCLCFHSSGKIYVRLYGEK